MILWLALSFGEPGTLDCELHQSLFFVCLFVFSFLGETGQLEETGVEYFPSPRYIRL